MGLLPASVLTSTDVYEMMYKKEVKEVNYVYKRKHTKNRTKYVKEDTKPAKPSDVDTI